MVEEKTVDLQDADIIQAVERHIIQRTGRRVHRLRVELAGDRLIIHGWTPSWHMKQMALQAVREVAPSAAVELCIQVSLGRHVGVTAE